MYRKTKKGCLKLDFYHVFLMFKSGLTYHSNPLKGKDGRPKEQRVVLCSAHTG